ncbi:MAG: sporulation protein YqfD [Alicyclobacillus sp.]|nr:sporulation protein YqfD [Alicyclobacillus sp.]
MTRAGWKAWWTGWLFLDLRGRRLQDLLVACQRTGLVLYDVAWVDGRVRVRLPLLSYGAFLRLCRAYQVRFRVLGRGGFPVWRRRLWQRKAWLAGVGVFVAGVYALGSVIWQVDVSGVDDQDRQVILQAARESGLYVGAWRPALPDAAALQADILEKLPSLLWVGVEVKGSKAQLQAVEKVPAQSQVAAQPHHIAAGKPGVVRKVFAERGQALVKPGQVVHPGQVLISGALAGGAVQVPAAGRVWAEVWYTSRVEVPLQVRWNGLTGERSERDYLVIGPWAVHVWGWDPPFTAAFTQDQETDWQFLKRMASRFHTGLIPASSFDKPKFYFGVPEGGYSGRLEDFHYSIRKELANFRISSENDTVGIGESDFIYYEAETDKVLDIGSEVDFKGKTLVVSEVYTEMKNSLLKHRYILCSKKGMTQNTVYHQGITGISLQGKVIAVEKDNVKVHLDIDKEQSIAKAWWFPYSTAYTAEGHSGWYCMPELNDYVRIYFPSHREEEAIAIGSVRKDSEIKEKNKLGNPDIKYFRTAFGKELMFSPEEIVITGKDGEIFIKLNEKDGIQIFSKKNIKIISQADITMSAEKKVSISAKDEINITCKESSIKMNGITNISGKEVKTN